MTVAIAALCTMQGGPLIIAAEDHMITSGDIEFEQPQPKMWRQGPHALAMMYGDAAAQAEIARRSEAQVLYNNVRDVGEIAEIYYSQLMDYVRKLAEGEILAPLGLNSNTFFDRQAALGPDISTQIINQLQEYFIRSGLYRSFGGAILIGADAMGGHIYKIEHGRRVLMDRIGFVAAGAGQWHAESQFMFSRYTSVWDFPEALSLVYAAKKRAEVAPGVGTETDLVIMTTNPPNVWHFQADSPLVIKLEEIYQASKLRYDAATAWLRQEVRDFIVPLLAGQQPPATQGTPAQPSTPQGAVSATPPVTPQQPTPPAPENPPSETERSEPGP